MIQCKAADHCAFHFHALGASGVPKGSEHPCLTTGESGCTLSLRAHGSLNKKCPGWKPHPQQPTATARPCYLWPFCTISLSCHPSSVGPHRHCRVCPCAAFPDSLTPPQRQHPNSQGSDLPTCSSSSTAHVALPSALPTLDITYIQPGPPVPPPGPLM